MSNNAILPADQIDHAFLNWLVPLMIGLGGAAGFLLRELAKSRTRTAKRAVVGNAIIVVVVVCAAVHTLSVCIRPFASLEATLSMVGIAAAGVTVFLYDKGIPTRNDIAVFACYLLMGVFAISAHLAVRVFGRAPELMQRQVEITRKQSEILESHSEELQSHREFIRRIMDVLDGESTKPGQIPSGPKKDRSVESGAP